MSLYLCHINASSSVELDGENICTVPLLDEKWVSGKSWQMGLLLGPSGSGKRFHMIFTHGACSPDGNSVAACMSDGDFFIQNKFTMESTIHFHFHICSPEWYSLEYYARAARLG